MKQKCLLPSDHWSMNCWLPSLQRNRNKNPKYQPRHDRSISTSQRSWVNTMLRKNLGDAKVGQFILNNGIPSVLKVPLGYKKVINKALLENMLDELMQWHSSLLEYIVQKKEDPNMAIAKRLSDIDEGEWREQRRQLKCDAKQRMKDGVRLLKEKRTLKRRWDDMSSTEKHLIADYVTDKSKKAYEATLIKQSRCNRES